MRRPPQGATHRPGLVRPGSGYGRLPGRPGPSAVDRIEAAEHRAWWIAVTVVVDELGRVHRTDRVRAPQASESQGA